VRLDLLIVPGFLATAITGVGAANAQISDDVVRIGVLNDQSNVYADLGGPGSVVAARMAIEDVGGKVLGKPVDILVADHQSKADVGASIARQWFDDDKVDMVIGFDNSSVALAVEQVAFQKNRIAIAGAIGTTAFTGKACTPNEAAWVYDAYARGRRDLRQGRVDQAATAGSLMIGSLKAQSFPGSCSDRAERPIRRSVRAAARR
jgi:branched-chain amino acid transport system substrate-binding protein